MPPSMPEAMWRVAVLLAGVLDEDGHRRHAVDLVEGDRVDRAGLVARVRVEKPS